MFDVDCLQNMQLKTCSEKLEGSSWWDQGVQQFLSRLHNRGGEMVQISKTHLMKWEGGEGGGEEEEEDQGQAGPRREEVVKVAVSESFVTVTPHYAAGFISCLTVLQFSALMSHYWLHQSRLGHTGTA